jgi:phage shock protein PspC (stress-responsive transcriptional regulator)
MDTRLYRSRDDRMLGGVAGGLADYLGVDPSLVRIGWVLLFLAGGIGLLLYIVMWIVVPEEDDLSPEELAAARTASGAGGPAPAGTTTSGTSVDWRTQRAAERDARRAARQARRAANPAAGRTAALVIGGLLVLVGVGFLLRDLIPAFNFDYVWPLILVILGVVVLVAAFRPGGLGGSGSGGSR